jgi:hypothetical protein
MNKVYCVYEDSHGMIGVAKDFSSAVNGLIDEGWLNGHTETFDDEHECGFSVKYRLGENWVNEIKKMSIFDFNIFFEGVLWISDMEIWGT